MKKSLLLAALLGATLGLASCKPTTSSNTGSNGTGGGGTTTVPDIPPWTPDWTDQGLASGTLDYSQDSYEDKAEVLYSLEKYALDNFTAGIPLYDDASYEQFSARVTLPSTKYLTNYGFGTPYGKIDATGTMYNGPINESVEEWKSYFHGYTTVDSGTFNAWDSQGSDVTDRMSMISSSYFGVKANADHSDYYWVGSLSMTDEPIMLDANGQVIENPSEDQTSQFWRVKVHTGEGYTYHMAPTASVTLRQKYDGRQVQLDDYLTPFKAMLNARLLRYTDLVSDTSGFQGAMEYVYDTQAQQGAWEDSGVGVQINEAEQSIDFAFIQPQSTSYARTALSSGLYSPVPAEFLEDIGGGSFNAGAKNFGTRSSSTPEGCFDNILVLGAYVPTYWEDQQKIVYESVDDYYEADQYHYDGYTEVIFSGENADVLAYNAFLNNELDEVSIPVSQLKAHRNDPNVLRTEGSTIIKLNLNSTTEEQWIEYFGENGTIYKHGKNDYWDVKPIMSNKNFLNGFFFAMNRQELADLAGKNPAVGYLSNAYMIDPAGKESWRASKWGQAVLWPRQYAAGNTACYSRELAETYFKAAGDEMISQGYYMPGDTIEIIGIFRYQTTIDNIGSYIASYVEDAFNAANASNNLKIDLKLEIGGSTYNDTYTKMDHGEFDFAEGAVSGVVLNPLDFMNTCSSTTAINQGFCLNWGEPTDEVNETNPAVYKGYKFSYDALWSASQGWSIIDEGVTSPVADNQQLIDSGDNVVFRATFPANATDDQGLSLLTFSVADMAVMLGNTATPQSGYYMSGNFTPVQNLNGYFEITVPKATLQQYIDMYHKDQGAVKYFMLYFSLVYSVDLGKIGMGNGVITKSVLITISGDIAEFGMTAYNS